MSRQQCYSCAYRTSVPGSAHSRCTFNFSKANIPMPQGAAHGIRNGWWLFPLNYDPTWMEGDCGAQSDNADKSLIRESSALEDIFSILGKRGL